MKLKQYGKIFTILLSLFKIILLLIPIAIIIFLILLRNDSISFKENAAIAEAQVIDIIKEVSKCRKRRVHYYPVIKFKIPSGKEITTTCYNRVGTGKREYIIGEKIIIHYQLNKPEEVAFYEDKEGDYVIYIVFIIVALIFFIGMFYSFFIKK